MKFIIIFLFWIFTTTSLQAKPVEIVLWHSMAGYLGAQLQALVHDFNQQQSDYILKPVYKGDYIESLTSFAAAFRAHQAPALIQVFEVGTKTMLNPRGIIKPVHDLMMEQAMQLPEADFFPVARHMYSQGGQLMAMPFNLSVPVIFYNADALAKIGYSSHRFPETWDELEILAKKLKHSGFKCAFTSAYPAWIFIESYMATQGLPMTDVNATHALYNHPTLILHLTRLRKWQHFHYFEYGGRADNATSLFTSGRCPLFSQSSGAYNSLKELVPFKLGVGTMPRNDRSAHKRWPNVLGGAALWAVAGQSDAINRGIATFFTYLAEPQVQMRWHERTGYLPLGLTGKYIDVEHVNKHPSLLLAKSELMNKAEQGFVPVNAQNQIRTINDEALEMIFAGIKSPEMAMERAVVRANHVLQRFMLNTNNKRRKFS